MKRSPTQIPKSLKTIDVKSLLRSRGVYLQQKVNKDMKTAALPLARKMLKPKSKENKPEHKPYHSFSYKEAIGYWEKQVHIIDVVEKKFEIKVQQFVTKMVDGFINNLDTEVKKSVKKSKGYFDDNEDEFLTRAQLDFTPLLVDQAVLAGAEALALINSKDIYIPYDYRKTIADNVAKFTQSMLDTDRQILIDIVEEAVKEGKTIPELRTSITKVFDEYSKTQAERITRTEVARVSNQASLDAWEQSGVVEGKQWVTFGAEDECLDYDGEVVALNANFYGADTEFQDGDPPLHPNCRCGTIPILID